ncbi:hypothetical protein [Modestobacter sp. Leaf380]|uniref:Rv0361 family membrane protein n=1 Tax=Modestobacter sp. Leaf380 TaxID=1736356 RepID=UPI000701A73D|nr:hypothetical protein [Modestobacter sp. Leaf380]KQS66223.1 hypothetical protein ASG41_12920 [Modestobacter sp. Leaf380]
MSTEGPFLYDDDPQPLHAGAGRPRKGLLLALGGGTLAVALVAVFSLNALQGSPEEQVEQVADVFTRALVAGDDETAWGLLCNAEQERLQPAEVAGDYLQAGTPDVGTATETELDGVDARLVPVRWDDDGAVTETELTLVAEDGPKVCAGS